MRIAALFAFGTVHQDADRSRFVPLLPALGEPAVFPFSRLVRIITVPLGYLTRQLDVHLEGKEVSAQDPGEPVGELALITRAPRSADVSAKGETRVLVIHCDAFEAILADRPAVTRSLLSVLAERLAGRT